MLPPRTCIKLLKSDFMPQKRMYVDGAVYFVTVRTFQHQKIFNQDSACLLFLSILDGCRKMMKLRLYAYAVMPDHVHLLILPRGKYDISDINHRIKGNFAIQYLRNHKGSVARVDEQRANCQGAVDGVGDSPVGHQDSVQYMGSHKGSVAGTGDRRVNFQNPITGMGDSRVGNQGFVARVDDQLIDYQGSVVGIDNNHINTKGSVDSVRTVLSNLTCELSSLSPASELLSTNHVSEPLSPNPTSEPLWFAREKRRRIRVNPIWQKSFYDRIIRSDRQMYNTINYINYNAVHHHLIDDPLDWLYTSLHNYDETGQALIEIDYSEE